MRNRYSSTRRGQWRYSKVSFNVKQGAEDFGLLFKYPGTWFGVFGPSFPKLPQYPRTCETGIARPTEGSDTRIRSHLMWNKELKTLYYFSDVPCTWFGIFRSSLPKLPQYLSACETGVIRSTQGLDTRVRSHLMWSKELKTLDYFLCDSVHDVMVFGPLFPKLPECASTQKISITQSLDDFGRWVGPHLMWNVELKTIDYFRRVPPHDLEYLVRVSPNLSDAQIP